MGKKNKKYSCFALHENMQLCCNKTSCRHWHSMEEHYNCTIVAAKKAPYTLEQIGNYFGVTRMRICQIEKVAKQKLSLLKTILK